MSLITRSRTVHAIAPTATYFYGVNEKNQTVAVSHANMLGGVSAYQNGAAFDGVTDDTAAIQAVIDANPGRRIVAPDRTARVSGTLTVAADNTTLDGFKLTQTMPNVDTVLFAPTTAGSSGAFLNSVGIVNSRITHASGAYTTATSGAGVRFLQCNGYKLFQTTVNDAFEGITVQGGQLGSLKSFSVFAANGSYAGDGTALLHFRQAPIGGGSYQPVYTCKVEDYNLSATKLRDACIRVSNCDGLNIGAGYAAFGKNALLLLKAERANSYISALALQGAYLDCANTSTGTINGVMIPDDGFAGTYIYDVIFGSGCTIGNGSGVGILARHPRLVLLQLEGGMRIANMLGYGVDVEGSTETTVQIGGTAFRNNAGGAIRLSSGAALKIVGNTFHANATQNINLEGSWYSGTITGNVGSNATPELVNTATFSNGLKLSDNSSPYTGSSRWNGSAPVTAALDFGAIAAGAYASLTISMPGAVVGDAVLGSVSGTNNIVDVGGGCVLLFSYGVTAADTVRVRAFNIGTASGDAGSLDFNLAIVR